MVWRLMNSEPLSRGNFVSDILKDKLDWHINGSKINGSTWTAPPSGKTVSVTVLSRGSCGFQARALQNPV
jgi:hypothetical protein